MSTVIHKKTTKSKGSALPPPPTGYQSTGSYSIGSAGHPSVSVGKKQPAALLKTSNGRKLIIDDCFLDYMNLISDKLGLPKYEDYQLLSDGDRKSFLREMKISEIIK